MADRFARNACNLHALKLYEWQCDLIISSWPTCWVRMDISILARKWRISYCTLDTIDMLLLVEIKFYYKNDTFFLIRFNEANVFCRNSFTQRRYLIAFFVFFFCANCFLELFNFQSSLVTTLLLPANDRCIIALF